MYHPPQPLQMIPKHANDCIKCLHTYISSMYQCPINYIGVCVHLDLSKTLIVTREYTSIYSGTICLTEVVPLVGQLLFLKKNRLKN